MRISLWFFLFSTVSCFSQTQSVAIQRETISALGTNSKKEGLNVHASVGQASIVSNETHNSNFHLSQGFQKAMIRKKSIDNWEISVFPNPNNGSFNFTATLPADEKISYEVVDIQGKLMYANNGLGGEIISVNLNTTADGLYFLKVNTRYTSSTIKIEIFQ